MAPSRDTRELLRLLGGRLPSADELEAIRLRRLRTLVDSVYRRVPYYRALFDRAELAPGEIRHV